ncbi:MAG: hypothetical protein NTW74_00240 [Acidobacteria bacterium]|nr:hypothetical protein [Acidobacteriota bacterium]
MKLLDKPEPTFLALVVPAQHASPGIDISLPGITIIDPVSPITTA